MCLGSGECSLLTQPVSPGKKSLAGRRPAFELWKGLRALTAGREMTAAQPSPAQRPTRPGGACRVFSARLGEVGGSPRLLGSPQRSRLPAGLACVRNNHRMARGPVPPLRAGRPPPQRGQGWVSWVWAPLASKTGRMKGEGKKAKAQESCGACRG